MKYRVIVTLEAASKRAAEKIVDERLAYDEDYGLGDYLFTGWEVQAVDEDEPAPYTGNPNSWDGGYS